MKTINSRSKSAENRSLHSGLLSILPLLCILFLGIPKAQAQQDSMVISAGYGISSCGTDTCCMEFTMYVERTGTRWFQLVMKAPNWASDSCFNLPCITNSVSTNGVTVLTDQVLNVDISIGGQITIAIGTDSTNGWTAGTYVQFYICKSALGQVDCQQQWQPTDWWSYDDLYPNANSPQDHNYGYDSSAYGFCGSPTPCNPACDVIEASSHGQYETFCVTRHDWPHQADSIVVTFDPLLQPCDSIRFTGDSSFRIHCDSTFLQDSSFIIGGPGGIRHDTMVRRVVIPCNGTDRDTVIQAWNSTRINAGGKTTMVFTPRSGFYKLAPCGVWCFTIKKCPSPVKHNVRIQTFPLGDTSGACTTDSTTPPQAFKISKQANNALFQMSEEQNYPNPLTWDKEFRTTIPFTIPNGGEAVIRISDATGKLIKSETMSFIDGGKHFFYFTATDLPAGKYYYQIEYPAGKVITNRSMLLIR